MYLGKNGDSIVSLLEEDGIIGESKRERKRLEFLNRLFMQYLIEMDDLEVVLQFLDEFKNMGVDKSSFYQKFFKSGGFFDKGGDGFVFCVLVDVIFRESKMRILYVFYNKIYVN